MGPTNTQVLEHGIGELAKRYHMEWKVFYDRKVKRVAIFVSKLDHCLYDLLIRFKSGELGCEIPVIISNHPNLAPIAAQFGVEFRYGSTELQSDAREVTFSRMTVVPIPPSAVEAC